MNSYLRAAEYEHTALPDTLSFLEWAEVFKSYIAETSLNDVMSYKLDETSAPVGDYAVAARISCAVFNALPVESRVRTETVRPEPYELKADATLAAAAPCVDQARWNTYLWGGSLYMNHCLIQDVNAYAGNAAKIGSLVTAVLASTGIGMPASIIIAAISAFLAVNVAWLVQADQHCGGSGAFLQIPWISIGTPFVKQNC